MKMKTIALLGLMIMTLSSIAQTTITHDYYVIDEEPNNPGTYDWRMRNYNGNLRFERELNNEGEFYQRLSLDRDGNIEFGGTLLVNDNLWFAPVTGRGIRFWEDNDKYQIHMGTGTEYHYGPVSSYAIKMNMNNDTGRGWVWGVNGQTPVAAISNNGDMQIEGNLTVDGSEIRTNGKLITYGGIEVNGTASFNGITQFTALQVNAIQPISGPDGYVQIQANQLVTGEQRVGSLVVGTAAPPEIANAIAHFDGRVYISEEGGGTEVGLVNDGDPLDDENYEDFLLWVEEGIVSKDFAIADPNDPSNPWPDYVFDEAYDLTSLEELDAFIKIKGHLPSMPAAEEVQKLGYTLDDITKRTVKTIEELTLHTIAQEKKIAEQNKLIQALAERIEKLEQ